MHDEGVWALAVDDEFTTFYSGGREGKVFATELAPGEGREWRCGECSGEGGMMRVGKCYH